MNEFKRDLSIEIISGVIVAIITAIATGLVTNYFTKKDIIEAISVRFNSVDSNMSYEQALQIVYEENENLKIENDNLKAQLDKVNMKINDQQAQIDKQKSEEEISKIIQNATEYGNSLNYVQALYILNNVKDKTPEIEMLINDYSQKYESSIIEQANSLKAEEKLDEACNLIKEAFNILPNSQTLKHELEEIENSYPKNMVDAVPAYESGGNGYKEYSIAIEGATDYFTMAGVNYTNGITFDADINILSEDITWAVYNLNNQFTNLEFIVGHVDGTYWDCPKVCVNLQTGVR